MHAYVRTVVVVRVGQLRINIKKCTITSVQKDATQTDTEQESAKTIVNSLVLANINEVTAKLSNIPMRCREKNVGMDKRSTTENWLEGVHEEWKSSNRCCSPSDLK